MPNLSRLLGVRIFMKREDLTGLGLGGNKTRALEFRMAAAVAQGCDCLAAALDVQSNAARQLTAAGNRLNLDAYLVLQGDPSSQPKQGNLYIDLVLGAHVRFAPSADGAALQRELDDLAAELRARGRRPYVMNADPGFELGSAFAGILCALECREQLAILGERPDYIYMSSRGKGQSGFALASLALQDRVAVVGIAAGRDARPRQRAAAVATRAASSLGIELRVSESDISNDEAYVGQGYGVPSAAGLDAIQRVARAEGVLLDPVYTGKAMAGLIDHVRVARVPRGAAVTFIHTGGTPALFRHADAILACGTVVPR